MEKLKELFTAFSGGLVVVVYLVYALAMYCIAGIAVSDITGWDWLGFIATPRCSNALRCIHFAAAHRSAATSKCTCCRTSPDHAR